MMNRICIIQLLFAGALFLSLLLPVTSFAYDTFEENIAKGIEALRQHNAVLAKQYFKAAKKDGKGPQKKYARRLVRKMRYLDDYCSQIKKGEYDTQSENHRQAYEHYQQAEQALKASFRKYDVPDLDSELSQRIDNRIQEANRNRQTAFQDAIDQGEQHLFEDDPHAALSVFQYAQSQMYRKEYASHNIQERVDDAQRKADYKDYVAKGNEYLADGDLHNARDWFYKAREKWITSEVDGNIEEVEVLLIEAYISEGESYFTVGAYEKALTSFQKAADYRKSTEVVNWIKQTEGALYNQFLMEGDTLSGRQAFPEAIAAFQKAQSYRDTDEIRQRIQQATEDHYHFLVDAGQQALQQDTLELALAHFEKAATVKSTEKVQSLIAETKEGLYAQYLHQAQSDLHRQAFSTALAVAKKAQVHQSTPEVHTLIKQAENGLEYEKLFQKGMDELENKHPDQAHQTFIEARSFWITDEVNQQIEMLETQFTAFDQYQKAGDLAYQRADLELALSEYQKARDVIVRKNIDDTIQEVEEKLDKYNYHFREGKNAYQQDQADQALQHFEQAAQYNRTSEVENWLDRAKRMPCTIAANLYGNTEKFDKIRLEVVDYYTLDVLYNANPSGTNYTFPKVPGGGDKKYYLRAFLMGDVEGKTAIKEAACDCSSQRRHEVGVEVE